MKRMQALFRRIQAFRKYRSALIYHRDASFFLYFLSYFWYGLRCRFQATIPAQGQERATAILVSYKRIQNMEPLVRCCLRCGWIDRIVVLNNNPAEHIADWVQIKDPRITLIDEGVNKGAMERYVFASQSSETFFVSIDDDIFLTPKQLTLLFSKLIENPSVPHGMFAQRWRGPNEELPFESFEHCVLGSDSDVDILNRVYFFTKTHAVECIRLAHAMGYETADSLRSLSAVDDVFLSFSGQGRPQCHSVGIFIDCPSQAEPGVAQWMQKDFSRIRMELTTALESSRQKRKVL